MFAAPTCTSRRAILSRAGRALCPATRWLDASTRRVRAPPGSPSVTGSASPGRRTCGSCRWCRAGRENLCPSAEFTGWDADGGFAELAVVDEAFAYRLPDTLAPVEAAPLLCSGIVGYRALRRATLPPGGRLGLYGFGASAHLVAQVAVRQGAVVHVMTRSRAAQALALELGVASASGAADPPPEPLDAAILFAPVGDLVPVVLRALDRGGVCVLAGIHLSVIPPLVYEQELFYEKEIRSVTANTRADGEGSSAWPAHWVSPARPNPADVRG